jgi:type I restriction enzyme, S subunit
MRSKAKATRTGGRPATAGVIPGRYALSVGKPSLPAPSKWDWRPLTQLARMESGHTPSRRKPEYWNGDIPWIGIRDATANHGRVIYETAQYINELGVANSSARLLPAHTVCVSRTASVGYVVVTGVPMATSQDFVNWVCSDELDWRFLKYVFLAEHDSLQRFAHGTTHQTIYFPEAKAFHVCVPPLREQQRIAWVLGSLDDKIESNRRIARTLEQLAATLFKARFVEFIDHDDLVDSELGPIPGGWQVGHLADIASITMGQSPPSSTYTTDSGDGPVMVQGKGSFGPRFPKREVFCTTPTRLAEAGDVLVTVRAPVGEVNVCRERTCLGRGVAGIKSEQIGFVESTLRHSEPRWRAHEGGTIYSSVNKKQVEQFPIVIPPPSLIDQFEQTVRPLMARLAACHEETESLGAIRDALLPRLTSGELRVSPAEGLATEAA